MPCISIKRSYGRKKMSSGEAKKTIVYQVDVMSQRLGISKGRFRTYVHSCILKSG
jgi:hypothetical protein